MKLQTLSWKSILLLSTPWLFPLLWYVLCAVTAKDPTSFYHVVAWDYHAAGRDWIAGHGIYSGDGFGFTYAPTSAAFLAPLALFPMPVFAFVFRLLSMLILLAGIYLFCQMMQTQNLKRTYFITTFFSAALCKAAFFEGQMHMLTTGLIMLALVALFREYSWRSAILFALALALKPTSIVMTALVLVLYSRLSIKLCLMIAATVLFTFLMQKPHYVMQQYIGFYHNFVQSMNYDRLHPNGWATLFGALHYYFGYVSAGQGAFLIRAVVAPIILILCYFIKKRSSAGETLFAILVLGMSYLMLFNSRTENNDYIMVVPAMAIGLALAYDAGKTYLKYGFIFLFFCMGINWNLTRWLSLHNDLWLSPTIVLFFALGALIYFFRKKQNHVCKNSLNETFISIQ